MKLEACKLKVHPELDLIMIKQIFLSEFRTVNIQTSNHQINQQISVMVILSLIICNYLLIIKFDFIFRHPFRLVCFYIFIVQVKKGNLIL